jgi:hypothetical protein
VAESVLPAAAASDAAPGQQTPTTPRRVEQVALLSAG